MAKSILCQSGIYKIENSVNGKFYIGSAVNIRKRWSDHRFVLRRNKHHSIILQRAWVKYGEESFHFVVVEEVDDPNLLIAREQHWIDSSSPAYNVARVAGSVLGLRHSDQAKKKMSEANLGKVMSAEARKKISDSQKAKGPFTAEHLANMSKAQAGRKCKPLSDEHKAKLSKALTGRSVTDEFRKKMSEIKTGRFISEKERQRLTELSRSRVRTPLSAETKAKIGNANRGKSRPVPEELKKKASIRMMGKKWTDEEIAKRVATRKANQLAKQQAV